MSDSLFDTFILAVALFSMAVALVASRVGHKQRVAKLQVMCIVQAQSLGDSKTSCRPHLKIGEY